MEEPGPNLTLPDLGWDAPPDNDSLADELLPLFPAPLLAGVTATCVALFVVGIAGNLLTMLVVSRFRELRTTTNLYLSSMAFSDLLIFLCMPLDLVRLWQYRPWNFGDLLCKLFQFVSESCTYATVLTITALSVERYFAICFPLRAKVVVTKGRVKLVILVIWAVAFCSAGPIFVLVGVEHENGTDPRDTNECRATEFAVSSGLLTVMVWVSSVFFFLPVFCLTVLYSLIGRKLWRRGRGEAAVAASLRDQNHRQTVKMLGGSPRTSGSPSLAPSSPQAPSPQSLPLPPPFLSVSVSVCVRFFFPSRLCLQLLLWSPRFSVQCARPVSRIIFLKNFFLLLFLPVSRSLPFSFLPPPSVPSSFPPSLSPFFPPSFLPPPNLDTVWTPFRSLPLCVSSWLAFLPFPDKCPTHVFL